MSHLKIGRGLSETEEETLHRIFSLLRSGSGHDFSLYKSNTICRRIDRRMQSLQIANRSAYADYLAQSEEEVRILLNELLIGVTSFFRDFEAYEVLKSHLIRQIKTKPRNSTYRVWIPACSTGEEAYSTAIILQECIFSSNKNISVQIFASDIDEDAIHTARAGIYSSEQLVKATPDRLLRFFTKINSGSLYRIHRDIREQIIFASQSVIKDPPFTRIDLLSCRNLLIYLGSQLQKKLLPLFHYSLNPNGLLFLGASESVGGFSDLFECLDKKYKIHRRKEIELINRGKMKFPITQPGLESGKIQRIERKKPMIKNETQYPLEQLLLEHCLPSCIITDKTGEVIYIHGSIGHLFEPASGVASLNIIDMARPGLETKLSYAIREVNAENSPLVYRNVIITDPTFFQFNLIVKWVQSSESGQEFILISFEEASNDDTALQMEQSTMLQHDPRVIELERELKYTKENLQSTIEELKSTNEEFQSTNEELQSTNEELETSKEELVTVNAELESRIEELSCTNDDIKNLLDSTHIATIFLDNHFHIKRYTPKAVEIIRLIPTDIGRSIFDIVHNLQNNYFFNFIEDVIHTGKSVEQEIESTNERCYYMRITPYNTMKGHQEGVVLTFEDITEVKRHRDELESLVQKRTLEIKEATEKLKNESEQRIQTEKELRQHQEKQAHMNHLSTIGEIATSIAHEINQPLANITNYIHGIQEWLESAEFDKESLMLVLKKLANEALRTSAIVNNMRNLIQKKPGHKEKIAVNPFIRDVVSHLMPKMENNKIQVHFSLENDCPPLFVDPLQLEQVLINILSNAMEAIKELPTTRRKIRIRTEYDDRYLRISIEDDGNEIPLETTKKIFDLFYTTKAEGLGMGLAISRTIIESYGGYINYISDNDRHNIFKITLPIDEERK